MTHGFLTGVRGGFDPAALGGNDSSLIYDGSARTLNSNFYEPVCFEVGHFDIGLVLTLHTVVK